VKKDGYTKLESMTVKNIKDNIFLLCDVIGVFYNTINFTDLALSTYYPLEQY